MGQGGLALPLNDILGIGIMGALDGILEKNEGSWMI
jgi:hypothetical protein